MHYRAEAGGNISVQARLNRSTQDTNVLDIHNINLLEVIDWEQRVAFVRH
jgi:hypothetical protein